jgi:hypothetical protein
MRDKHINQQEPDCILIAQHIIGSHGNQKISNHCFEYDIFRMFITELQNFSSHGAKAKRRAT